jgi:sulfotransferase
MPKTIHFVSGLPRSCSTLLCNLLAQHPDVHATGSSPLHEIGYVARNFFKTDEAKAMQPKEAEAMYFSYVRGGIISAFDSLTDRSVVADKNRSWIGHLDQLFKVFPEAKVLVPVRDVRAIIASMEKIFRKHPSPINGPEGQNPQSWTTTEKRAQGWLGTPPVGIAIERLHEAVTRFKGKLHFVHAEELTTNPTTTMNGVWSYLGLEAPAHDFDNVEQYTHEHEIGWPYGDHTIRGQVKPLVKDYNEILGKPLADAISQKFNWINDL